MFNIGPAELMVIGLVLLIAVGPEQLPSVIRRVGSGVAQLRSMTEGLRSEFMAGIEEMERAVDPEEWGAYSGESSAAPTERPTPKPKPRPRDSLNQVAAAGAAAAAGSDDDESDSEAEPVSDGDSGPASGGDSGPADAADPTPTAEPDEHVAAVAPADAPGDATIEGERAASTRDLGAAAVNGASNGLGDTSTGGEDLATGDDEDVDPAPRAVADGSELDS